jgi:tRNA pseudouridine13 synthase
MSLSTSHWRRLHGVSLGNGVLKHTLSDFVVEEQLGFIPSGSGEHIFLWLEKTNLNTAFVAEEIAKFANLPLRNITYAGRKDKFALTRQWFGVHIANFKEPDWNAFNLEGARILEVTRNDRKLRVGVLKSNRFEVTIRNIHFNDGFNESDLLQRLEKIKQLGAPNYYGSQRFGEIRVSVPNDSASSEVSPPLVTETNSAGVEPVKSVKGGNLALAEKLIDGEQIRNRNKRSMAISALRSWLFNEVIHQRIEQDCFFKALPGDAMQLSGSNSFFVNDKAEEQAKVDARLAAYDINITAPMWGNGKLHTSQDAKEFELACVSHHKAVTQTLNDLGLKQERRAIRIVPEDFEWHYNDDVLKLSFSLPSGCFATSIVRELMDV